MPDRVAGRPWRALATALHAGRAPQTAVPPTHRTPPEGTAQRNHDAHDDTSGSAGLVETLQVSGASEERRAFAMEGGFSKGQAALAVRQKHDVVQGS